MQSFTPHEVQEREEVQERLADLAPLAALQAPDRCKTAAQDGGDGASDDDLAARQREALTRLTPQRNPLVRRKAS